MTPADTINAIAAGDSVEPPMRGMTEAELQALYDEMCTAYMDALKIQRRANELERRYQEAQCYRLSCV